MRFPTTVQDEIPNWMSIKAHESANNLAQDVTTNWGKPVGEVQIVAPNAIVENNSHNYAAHDFKASHALSRGIGTTGFEWSDILNSAKGASQIVLDLVSKGAGAEAGRLSGMVVNPRSEQMYTAPAFRSFSFHWELTPYSQGDADGLKEIYDSLRKWSYPKLGHGGLLYKMPHEFEIQNVGSSGGELKSFGKYGKSVITNINMNYTGAGIAATFSSNSGAPPFFNLDITFTEVTLQHQGSDAIKNP
jgi:hypothetical protein